VAGLKTRHYREKSVKGNILANKKILSFVFSSILLFSGCVSATKRSGFVPVNIHGKDYVSLPAFCSARDVNKQYDQLSRSIVLQKYSHQIRMMVGDTFVLVDGKPLHLYSPVEMYNGQIFIPDKFRQQTLDILFGEKTGIKGFAFPAGKIKKIIVDAGHGGKDPGAISRTGILEKDVTLDIAQRLSSLLKSEGLEVSMTRSNDTFIPLEKRVDITNDSSADLFISIHANANRARSLKGFEVYYITSEISDLARAVSSAKNSHLNLDNACLSQPSSSLKAALWDMAYTYSRAESVELSRSICRAIPGDLNTKVLGVKSANFCVLRGAAIPAVLVEVGFLSNPQEANLLRQSSYRQQIAQGLLNGIRIYAARFSPDIVQVAKARTSEYER
jgi:N-acetylmuramoyl-L-alanine amidase